MDANSQTLQFRLGSHSQWQVKSARRLDFSKLNEENLLNDFASLDQSYMNDSNSDVNTKFNEFYPALMN